MIADLEQRPWRWGILPPLVRDTFKPRDETPVPIWAKKWVFLSRRITTKPGYYDVEEFPWTYEYQDFFRTRKAFEKKMPDGAVCLVEGPGLGVTSEDVSQCTWKKSSVAGVTEGALNGVRYVTKNDPQNIIFAIDNRVEAGTINEVRLQPTLRQLGENIFSARDEDAGKFLLKLQRNLIYFLGSYSSGAFANKMAEICVGDELEEHGKVSGDTSSVENLRSRVKSAERPFLVLMSKPKLAGGPIDAEFDDGSQHVYEIPCPHCSTDAGGELTGYHQLLQENMRFGHCKDLLGNWDKKRVLAETYFECPHCMTHVRRHEDLAKSGKDEEAARYFAAHRQSITKRGAILESEKRWFNDRSRRRWRRTNFNATPGHISFHISDFYGYHRDATWGRLALKYIKSKGNPVARQGYRNHHEGLAWEQRATKTTIEDIKACRQPYRRGNIPRKPWVIILGADVGLTYVSWVVTAFSRDGEAWVIDWGKDTHPDALKDIIAQKRYVCAADGQSYRITYGYVDAKYRKLTVHKACVFYGWDRKTKRYIDKHRLWPTAGLNADLATRSLSFSHVPKRPAWFGVTVFVDRDFKSELYTERINGWVEHRDKMRLDPGTQDDPPNAPPLWFPEDIVSDEEMLREITAEHLVQKTAEPGVEEFLPDASKEYIWKRKGPNHKGDALKNTVVGFRWITRNDADQPKPAPADPVEEAKRQAAILAAVMSDSESEV